MADTRPQARTTAPFAAPIATERTFEQAIERIVEGIERAKLRVGDRLPNEAELAEQLRISKPTLRQALRVLQRAQLIDVRRGAGGGIFLAADLVPIELVDSYVASEEHQVVETLIGRRMIESAVAKLALVAATEEDLDELNRTVELLERHRGNRAMVFRADAAFHRALARACHNHVLQEAMRTVGRELAPIRDAYPGDPEQDETTLDIHRRQLHAMRLRDAAALEQVLDEHFRQLETAFASAVDASWEELFAIGAAGAPRSREAPKRRSRTTRR